MKISENTKLLYQWIAQGEHQQQDFKFEISNAKKIAKTLSAFANTQGGRLLIGVKDNGRIAGVESEEELYMIESAADIFCTPPVKYESELFEMEDGKHVLCINIPKENNPPIYAKDEQGRIWAYLRYNDQNILAYKVQLEVLKNRSKPKGEFISYTQEEEYLLDTLEENLGITINKLAKATQISRTKVIELLTKFTLFDVVHAEPQNNKFVYLLKTEQ